MAKEADKLVLSIPREIRVDMKTELARLDETLHDVRRHVVSIDLRVEALDAKFEMIREGTASAIGFAADARRAHVDLRRRTAELPRQVEKLELAK